MVFKIRGLALETGRERKIHHSPHFSRRYGPRDPPRSPVRWNDLPGPETLDGVHYDANLKRVYMTGGRWYGTPDASPGWVYVYQQKDPDHYDVISKNQDQTRFGHFVPQLNRFYVASQTLGDQEAEILVFEPVP